LSAWASLIVYRSGNCRLADGRVGTGSDAQSWKQVEKGQNTVVAIAT